MKNRVRFGIIGAGRISQAYGHAFLTCDETEVVAVADVRLEAAQALAEQLSCRSYSTHESMAEKETLDAVLVCTPPHTHPEISIYFMKRGVHVLCEKPLSIDRASAVEMLETARKAGVLLTMASKFRYVQDVIQAKSIVASGILGQIVQFENSFCARVDMSQRWNSNPALSGGGVMIDNGTHSVDILRYFLGPVAEINVVEGVRREGYEVEDTVSVFTRSLGGAIGIIDLSWSFNKHQDSYLRLYGTQGVLSVGWKESSYRHDSSPDLCAFGRGYDKIAALRSQVRNFARALSGKESLLLNDEDVLASVEVMLAAYTSLRQKRWIPVYAPGHENNDIAFPAPVKVAGLS